MDKELMPGAPRQINLLADIQAIIYTEFASEMPLFGDDRHELNEKAYHIALKIWRRTRVAQS